MSMREQHIAKSGGYLQSRENLCGMPLMGWTGIAQLAERPGIVSLYLSMVQLFQMQR
jgi:hypothetical protein